MLTVRQALELPVFKETTLVAGQAGLDNPIQWVHTVDIPDASYKYKRPGILLLTAGFGLQDSEERQLQLIPKLVEENFAGMVFSTGWYFDNLPDAMRKQADELGFPIIESPPDLMFIEITQAVLDLLVNYQHQMLQRASDIYDQLTELVLRGGNLANLANRLANLINRSIVIEDSSLKVLAQAQVGEIDEARRNSVVSGRTSPEVSQRLFKSGIYAQLRHSLKPVAVPRMPDLGMTLSRLVVPIVVDRQIYGYFWIITEEATQEFDLLAAVHGATVAALIMFKERAVQEAEAAMRGDFFEQLISGKTDSNLFRDQARRINFRIDKPHQVILIYGLPEGGGSPRPLLRDITEWLQRQALAPLAVWHNDMVVLVVDHTVKSTPLAEKMLSELSHPARKLLIGIGSVAEEIQQIQSSYDSAWETIHIARMLNHGEGVRNFNDLGLMHWLYHLPREQFEGNIYLSYVETLANHDSRRGTELVKTLEGYLDNGGNLVDTAYKLHIHRNTLVHRVRRIEGICEIDLRNPMQRLNLHVAVKHYRLQSGWQEI